MFYVTQNYSKTLESLQKYLLFYYNISKKLYYICITILFKYLEICALANITKNQRYVTSLFS